MNDDANKKRIMIVDDEVELASLYQTRLQAEGYEVKTCRNGESALAEAKAFKPDLIMLDIMMPQLSGFDAIELFRTTLETKAAYIIIFSALSQPDDVTKAKQAGADDYITKTYTSFEEVVSRVKQALSKKSGDPTSIAGHVEQN